MSTAIVDATFCSVLRSRAALHPNAPAYTWLRDGEDDAQTITFAELDARATRIAAALLEEGLSGQPVLLLYPTGLDYAIALIACFYAGAIAVPAYPPTRTSLGRASARIAAIAKDAGVRVALTNAAVRTACEAVEDFRVLQFLATDTLPLIDASNVELPIITLRTPCVLQYTSGSTGTPKGVLLRQQQLTANQQMIQSTAAIDGPWVTWLPPYHDMGLMGGILHPPFVGAHAIILSPEAFIRRPLRWLQAVTKYKAAVTLAPNFAFELCVRRIGAEDRASLDLSSLQMVFNGAEPINPETLDAFSENFAPHGFRREAFYPCYGMAEATLIISGGDAARVPVVRSFDADALKAKRAVSVRGPRHSSRRLVGCGRSLLDETIYAVDPETHEVLPDRHIGEIWVSSRSVADGYWQRAEETERTFKARLKDGRGPFLRTGDLGFLDEGELFVTGRLKDVIIIRGQNHFPHDIERTVQSVDASLLGDCGAAFSVEVTREERLVVVQEVDHRLKPDLTTLSARILEAIRKNHDLAVHSLVLIKKGSSLKTSSGKIQRRALRQAFLEGELSEVARVPALLELELSSAAIPEAPEHANDTHVTPPRVRDDDTHTRLMSTPRLEEKLRSFLCERIARKMNISSSEIDVRAPLAQYGVDSLIAAEITEELEKFMGCALPTTISYDHPTAFELARALRLLVQPDEAPLTSAASSAAPKPRLRSANEDPVVIVGMGCRFPGAPDLRGFWHLLRHGVDAITEVPEERFSVDALYDSDPSASGKLTSRYGGFVEGIDHFDPAFFGISEREAARMDPQQRLFLEVAWEALEDACISPASLSGTDASVFSAVCSNDYTLLFSGQLSLVDADYGTGNAPSIVANRLSYFLNLKGPSMAIDAACASSLVAVQSAAQCLVRGDTQVAIVGGVNAVLAPEPAVFFSKARALAADGRCKAFDASADGFVRSEGCGVVVLKRLSRAERDGDRVYAVVAGGAVNHDGTSNGLMAPSARAQQQLIQSALEDARITADDLDYVEAHGVGAKLADAVELQALGAVLTGRTHDRKCMVGSVKTNLGHLEAASGMASLIKTALALSNEEVPPHLHLSDVHPDIGIERFPIEIPTAGVSWKRGERARFAGISTFGFGGTNAHVVLREAPSPKRHAVEVDRPLHVLALSAQTPAALDQLVARYGQHLSKHAARTSLADICFSASTGRSQLTERLTFLARDLTDLQRAIHEHQHGAPLPARRTRAMNHRSHEPRIGMLFSDGDVPVGSGQQLYAAEPVFKQALDHAAQILKDLVDYSLLDTLFGRSIDHLDEARAALVPAPCAPVCRTALDYATHALLGSWGVLPSAVLGQGCGEYSAAAVSGVMSWQDALTLVAKRTSLLRSMRAGATQTLTMRQFRAELAKVELGVPKLRFVSGSLQRAFAHDEAVTLEHFAQHVYHTSVPDEGWHVLAQEGLDAQLSMGPSAGASVASTEGALLTLDARGDDYPTLLGSLAELYCRGASVDWQAFDAPFSRTKLALPTYPFQRRRYWLDFPQRFQSLQAVPPDTEARTVTSHPFLQRMTKKPAVPAQSGFVRKEPEQETG